MINRPANLARQIVLVYGLVACAWIVGVDWFFLQRSDDALLDSVSIYGWDVAFVIFSSTGIYLLIKRILQNNANSLNALRSSEGRFRSLYEDSPIAIWEEDLTLVRARFYELRRAGMSNLRDHLNAHPNEVRELALRVRLISANRASQSLFQTCDMDRQSSYGPGFFTAESHRLFLEALVALEAGQTRFRCEMPSMDATGQRLLLDMVLTVLPGHEQSLSAVMVSFADITARKMRDAQVADALDFREAIIRTAPVGILTFGSDGQMLSANEAAGRILGATGEELLELNFHRVPNWERLGLIQVAREVLAEGGTRTHQVEGTSLFGLAINLEVAFARFYHQGEARLLLILNDVKAREEAGRNLRLLHAALLAVPEGIMITNAEGRIEWVNPGFTRLCGYTLEDLAGSTPHRLNSGEHEPAFFTQLWQTLKQGEIWEGEIQNRRKDGSLYTEAMTVAPVRDAAGRLTHYVATKRDISKEKQLEQQLSRTQRLDSIGMLASGIAHDLNNVLTPIMLSTDLLRSQVQEPVARSSLDMLAQSARRGAGLLKQVLTFVRGGEGERAALNPRYLLKEIVSLIRETFPRGIEVRLDLPSELPTTLCDITQMHQVLMNLAVNARDAMPGGGVLTLRARELVLPEGNQAQHPGLQPGHYVELLVKDSGTGMPDHILEHIFDPFFTTKPRGEGTGLGLSLSHDIVTKGHGGTLTVQSQAGQGTESCQHGG